MRKERKIEIRIEEKPSKRMRESTMGDVQVRRERKIKKKGAKETSVKCRGL